MKKLIQLHYCYRGNALEMPVVKSDMDMKLDFVLYIDSNDASFRTRVHRQTKCVINMTFPFN